MTENRIQKLEEALAHQDQQIADLSEMLIRQNKDIAALRAEITKLGGRVESLQDTLESNENSPRSISDEAAQNKPPHY